MKFKGPAAYVSNLDVSRKFYEELLGLSVLRVMMREGREIAVAYQEGLSIWLATDAYFALFGDAALAPAHLQGGNWELTFETPDYEPVYERLRQADTRFVYAPRELPWGQRGFRAYDPDGHIVDISETHGALARRLFAAGANREEIAAQISMPLAQVDAYLTGAD